MKKVITFGGIAIALIAVLIWFGKKNSASPVEFETEKAQCSHCSAHQTPSAWDSPSIPIPSSSVLTDKYLNAPDAE